MAIVLNHWLRRIGIAVVAVLLGVEVLYVLLANVALNTGLISKAFAGTNSVLVTVKGGWTVFPGFVHVRDVDVKIQDKNVQSLIHVGRADVTLVLHELLTRRTFHATRVRGSGVVFRFRNRVMPESRESNSTRALPPIDGFEDPPVFEALAPEAPIPEAEYNLWSVHLEDVDVTATELWVQQFRYLGGGRAVGAFKLRPARRLWVGPATLTLAKGRVLAGGRDTFTGFGGHVDCTVHDFDVRPPEGLEVLRNISTAVHLGGVIADGRFVEMFLPPEAEVARVEVEQKGGTVKIDAALDHGVFTKASRVELAGDSFVVHEREVAIKAGAWSTVLSSVPNGEGGRVIATVASAAVARSDESFAPATLSDLVATADSTTRDAAVDWGVVRSEVSLREGIVSDLRIFHDVGFGIVRPLGGALVARGRLVDVGEIQSGTGYVELRKVAVAVGRREYHGSATFTATSSGFDESRGTGVFDATLDVFDGRGNDVTHASSCPWSGLERVHATMHVDRKRRLLDSSTVVNATVTGGTLLWGDVFMASDGTLSVTANPEGSGSKQRSHVVIHAATKASRVRAGEGPPKRWGAQMPEATVDASLDLDDEGRTDGSIAVRARHVAGAIGKVSVRADVLARVHVREANPNARTLSVSGVIDVDRASLWSGERRVDDWWAKIALDQSDVHVDDNLDFDGRVGARFKDGLPALLALSDAGTIPGFLPHVLPLHGLSATLDVKRACQLMDVDLGHLEGGPLVATGRIQNSPGDTRGAVLVSLSGLSVVSAGVSLGKDGDGVSLFSGDTWLGDHLAKLSPRPGFDGARCPPPVETPSCAATSSEDERRTSSRRPASSAR